MCDGNGMAMYGEPHVAAECTCTAREFGRCARPTVRPGRNVHDDRDHGDGSDTRARGRRTSGSLTETRVRDWQDWPDRFDGSAGRHMTPCPLAPTRGPPGVVASQVRLTWRQGKPGQALPACQHGSPRHARSLDVCKT